MFSLGCMHGQGVACTQTNLSIQPTKQKELVANNLLDLNKLLTQFASVQTDNIPEFILGLIWWQPQQR